MRTIFALVLFTSTICLAGGGGAQHKTPIIYPPKEANKALVNPPGAVTLVEPKFFSAITGGAVTLKWNGAESATHYHVQVATDANFKWLVKNEYSVSSTEFQLSGLEPATHYFWRVAAVNSANDPSYNKGPFAKGMFETK